MVRSLSVLVFVALVLTAALTAGEYNPQLNVGDPGPAWVDLPGVDGKKHSLADFQDKEVVVVVFLCNSCIAAIEYEERILGFVKKHTGKDSKVALVAINVNTIEEDRLDKMKERAREKGFPFPYLYDESQKIGRLYGARYTPEFFVLNKERKVVYMGAMDDRDPPAMPKVSFLELAVQAALKGQKPEVTETLGRGCRVRYNREKKK